MNDIKAILQSIVYTFFVGNTYLRVGAKQYAIPNAVIFLLVFVVMRSVFRMLGRFGLRPILRTLKLV